MDGKQFEKLIQDSAKLYGIDCVRLRDAGFTGEKQESKRFTIKNICDFILFDGKTLFKLEAKKRNGSCTFSGITQANALMREREKVKDYEIESQIVEGVLVFFEKAEKLYFVNANSLPDLMIFTGKKSFNAKDCAAFSEEQKFNCYEINMTVPPGKRKNYINLNEL